MLDLRRDPALFGEPVSLPVLAIGPSLAVTAAPTAGVPLFERCPAAHSVIVGGCHLEVRGLVSSHRSVALPGGTPHRLLSLTGSHACVAYLDPRRYTFEDAQRLAHAWRRFVPGRDDVREAFGDAISAPRRRVDRRALVALEALDADDLTIAEAARRVGLSESRLTHLVTDTLGSPPRSFRTWFKLRRAIGEALFGGATLTQAAHRAGFADSAHLTRTCKQLMGVRPAQMMPRIIHVMNDTDR